MTELDQLLESYRQQSPEVERAAMKEALETADASTKEFLEEYREAEDFYDTVLRFTDTDKYEPEIGASIRQQMDIIWKDALENASDIRKKDLLKQGLLDAADTLIKQEQPLPVAIGNAIKELLLNIKAASSASSRRTVTRKPASRKKKDADEDKEEEDKDREEEGTRKENQDKKRKRLLKTWKTQIEKLLDDGK